MARKNAIIEVVLRIELLSNLITTRDLYDGAVTLVITVIIAVND